MSSELRPSWPPENSAFPASPREIGPVKAQSGYLLNPLWFMNSQMRPIQVKLPVPGAALF